MALTWVSLLVGGIAVGWIVGIPMAMIGRSAWLSVLWSGAEGLAMFFGLVFLGMIEAWGNRLVAQHERFSTALEANG